MLETHANNSPKQRETMKHKVDDGRRGIFVAWYYIISGAIGLIVNISEIMHSYITVSSAVPWILLLIQIVAAFLGGTEVLRGNVRGYQILYWVSFTCIPVFGSSLITYYSAIGIGLIPTMSLGAGYSGTSILFKFGYESSLQFFSGAVITTFGINLVAIMLTIHLRNLLNNIGIRAWPLESITIQPILPVLVNSVIYAKDIRKVSEFYKRTLSLSVLEETINFIAVGDVDVEIIITKIPETLAKNIYSSIPPDVREKAMVKCSFLVEDLSHVQDEAVAAGGGTKPLAAAWRWRGQLHLDGHDPEGNVVQFRTRDA
jgi:hypothetical protein